MAIRLYTEEDILTKIESHAVDVFDGKPNPREVKFRYRRLPQEVGARLARQSTKKNRLINQLYLRKVFAYCVVDWEDGFFDVRRSHRPTSFPYTLENIETLLKYFDLINLNTFLKDIGAIESTESESEEGVTDQNGRPFDEAEKLNPTPMES